MSKPRFVIKAEPVQGAGYNAMARYAPVNKLRARAASGLGELQEVQLAVQRMMRTQPETAPAKRHVVVLEDVTRGLGLDYFDEQRIQKAISDTNVEFGPKTQTQRLLHAQGKLVELLRSMKHLTGDARMEIATRATEWWRKSTDTDLNRPSKRHYISYPQSQLTKAITHKYVSRRKVGNRWVYEYKGTPGKGESVTIASHTPESVVGTVTRTKHVGEGWNKRKKVQHLHFDHTPDGELTVMHSNGGIASKEDHEHVREVLAGTMTKAAKLKVDRWITVRGARIPIVNGEMHGPVADKLRAHFEKKKSKGKGEKKDEKGKKKPKTTSMAQALQEGYEAGKHAQVLGVGTLATTIKRQSERDEKARQQTHKSMVFVPPAFRKIDLEWK